MCGCDCCTLTFSRFCVTVQRDNFPADTNGQVCPAHTLTLLPPLTVSNLLPCDIQFYLLGTKMRRVIKRGKEIAIYSVSRAGWKLRYPKANSCYFTSLSRLILNGQ